MKAISSRIPERLVAELAAVARRKGVSRSAVIREAVERFLDADEVAHPKSALDLVADFVGVYEGPADLSVNKKYMQGYGE